MSSSGPISSVNDFVVRFANVNGSGSASANELFARAVLSLKHRIEGNPDPKHVSTSFAERHI